MRVYGILDSNDAHVDVSLTERGAKRYATIHGYNIVTYRVEYNAVKIFQKVNNKWQEIKN